MNASEFDAKHVANQQSYHFLIPPEAVFRPHGGYHSLGCEIVNRFFVEQRPHEEIAETMGKEVGKCLSTRIVIENLLAIGLNSGETEVEYLLADKIF